MKLTASSDHRPTTSPASPTLGRCAPSVVLHQPEQHRRHLQLLYGATHRSASRTPRWCPPPTVPLRIRGGRPPQPPDGGHHSRELGCQGRTRRRLWRLSPVPHDRCAPPRSRLRIHAFPKPPPERKMHDDGQVVKETATSAQTRSRGQWETQPTEQQHPWARRRHCGEAHPHGPLCARKSARSLSARTGMRWRSRCCHSNRDAASCCYPVQNHPGSTSSELICRTCCCIEVG